MFGRVGLLLLTIVVISNATNPECQFGLNFANKTHEPLQKFMVDLYRKIASVNPDKNIVFSPVSIILALALAEAGAGGETQTQLRRVLAPPGYDGDISSAYQALQHNLRIQEEKAKLSIANSLFYDNDLTIKPEYLEKVKKCFETAIEQVNFAQTEAARQKINTWCSNATAQKIPELLKPGVITADTVAVLANAIYFKAAWEKAFEIVEDHQFYELGKAEKAKTTKFMVRTGRFKHASNDHFEMLEIPYKDAPIGMIIAKAKAPNTAITTVEPKFRDQSPVQVWQSAVGKNVALKLPRFSIRLPTDLTNVLSQLGLTNMFTNNADFTRMDTQNSIRVSKVVHEAFIKVNENGTEAAAATAVTFERKLAHFPAQEPIPFTVDYPFLFSIIHHPTGALLFTGKVNTIEDRD